MYMTSVVLSVICKIAAWLRASLRINACGQVGQGEDQRGGHYCALVKHPYSLICPRSPSVLLNTNSHTTSVTPRTTQPTHMHAIYLHTVLDHRALYITSRFPFRILPFPFFIRWTSVVVFARLWSCDCFCWMQVCYWSRFSLEDFSVVLFMKTHCKDEQGCHSWMMAHARKGIENGSW